MHQVSRLRVELMKLPIVDVDFVVGTLKSPNTKKSLYGVRRHVVEKATQVLEEAKRNQIDGFIELDGKDISLMLQAMSLTIEWQGDLLFFEFGNDEE